MIANTSYAHMQYVKKVEAKVREMCIQRGIKIRRGHGEITATFPDGTKKKFYGFIEAYNYISTVEDQTSDRR